MNLIKQQSKQRVSVRRLRDIKTGLNNVGKIEYSSQTRNVFLKSLNGRYFFTGHIPQVRIQVTVLQINKQDQKRLHVFLIEGKLLGLLKYQ